MNFRIRRAAVSDAEGIARVIVDGWHATYAGIIPDDFLESMKYAEHAKGTKRLLERLGDDARAFVAEADGAIVGTLIVTSPAYPVDHFDAEIVSFYVSPSHQRKGVGGGLLLEAAQWLRSAGRTNLFIWLIDRSPYAHLGERFAAEQVPADRSERIGESVLKLNAWGWRDLDQLVERLTASVS